MEAVSENTGNATLFWGLFNEVLEKVSSDSTTMFNPIGLCTDMGESNFSTIRKVAVGDSVVNRIKKLSKDKPPNMTLLKVAEADVRERRHASGDCRGRQRTFSN